MMYWSGFDNHRVKVYWNCSIS